MSIDNYDASRIHYKILSCHTQFNVNPGHITFSQYNDHTPPSFRDLNILKFLDVIHYLNCIFMFTTHLNMLPSSFSNFFTSISSRHKYETRLASWSTICIPSVRTNYGIFNTCFKGAFLWNNLEESVTSLSL